jgi:VanZ family protein
VSERSRGIFAAAGALAWAALIGWASHQSHPFLDIPEGILSHDKLIHVGVFGVLAVLSVRALRLAPLTPVRAVLLAWVLSTGWGLVDEIHQSFIPGRDASPWDVAADAAGAAAGACLRGAGLRRVGSRASIRA